MPPLPCEKRTIGKGPPAIATSRYERVRTIGMPSTEITSRDTPAIAASVAG
jgi:hypothetical protein